jgi:addiction module HigA family antidote
MSASDLAQVTTMSEADICLLLNGETSITPDIASQLAQWSGTSPELWLNLQKNYERIRDGPWAKVPPEVLAAYKRSRKRYAASYEYLKDK